LTAVWLDLHIEKREILTRYLNQVYLGAGAYGMSAAARIYFDKDDLSQLTLSEAAMLAGLIKAPSLYNPIADWDAARSRAEIVLDSMVETGAIDVQTAEAAKARPAKLIRSSAVAPARNWFAHWIARHEFPKISGLRVPTMRVRTTLRPDLQELAEGIVDDVLSGPGVKRNARQAALVALRPDGAILAMVGGRNYDESQFNRAADAKRQPGSAFKLFVYLAALRSGYSLDDMVDASPLDIGGWRPKNFGGRRYGHVSLSNGFIHSINTGAVRLAMNVGLDKLIATARDLGIDAGSLRFPAWRLVQSKSACSISQALTHLCLMAEREFSLGASQPSGPREVYCEHSGPRSGRRHPWLISRR
jgi:membrane peptidoglycan carboxypeptidase